MSSFYKSFVLFIAFMTGISCFSQSRYINVDGTKIWVNTMGLENREAGQPAIVFESGYGTPMDHWDRVLEGVSSLAPLVTYDRPGIGKSDPVKELPTIENISERLIKILNKLGVDPPYILVGHSLGGVYVRGFAGYHPDLLAGLIMIDPADFTENHKNKRDYYEVLNWSEKKIDIMVGEVTKGLAKRNENAPSSIKNEGKILAEWRATEFKEIHDHPLPNIPVHILTGGRFDMPDHMRSKDFDDELLFRSKMKHRVARWTEVIQSVDKGMLFYSGDAGHFVHYDDPELLVSSVKIVLQDYFLLRDQKK